MALVRYGGGIVQMSGSIAGSTFARNRYGNYTRARTKPVNPNTPAQIKIRAVINLLTEYWADSLNATQRTAWNLYADNVAMKNKLGETIKLSGFNHFIRSNSIRLYFARPLVANGPTDFLLPGRDETLAIDVDSSPQVITITYDDTLAWNQETGGYLFMQQGRPQNGQRNFFAGPWHYAGSKFGKDVGAGTSPGTMVMWWAVAEGQKQWCRFRVGRADGRLSEPWMLSTIVHSEAPFEVPAFAGFNEAQYEGLLIHQQLTLGNVANENSDTVPVDIIIRTDPVPGTILHLNAPVDIVVSLGPA